MLVVVAEFVVALIVVYIAVYFVAQVMQGKAPFRLIAWLPLPEIPPPAWGGAEEAFLWLAGATAFSPRPSGRPFPNSLLAGRSSVGSLFIWIVFLPNLSGFWHT